MTGIGDSLPIETNAAPTAKLPVIRTIVEGLAALRPAWRRVLVLLLVILILEIALDLLYALVFGVPSQLQNDRAAMVPQGPGDILLRILRALVEILVYTNLLLAIARLVLFAETPPVVGLFRWGRRQWRLLGNTVMIGLAAAMPAVVGGFLTPHLGPFLASPTAITAFLLIYALCWLWAAGWLSSVIPIIASDDPGSALDKAWRVAAGNKFRLMGIPACILGGILIAIGSRLIFEAFFTVDPLQLGIPGYALLTLLIEAIYVAYAAIGAAAYRRLTGQIVDRDTTEAE
jgi:hypothetical protein